jgi:hypothetical protein
VIPKAADSGFLAAIFKDTSPTRFLLRQHSFVFQPSQCALLHHVFDW